MSDSATPRRRADNRKGATWSTARRRVAYDQPTRRPAAPAAAAPPRQGERRAVAHVQPCPVPDAGADARRASDRPQTTSASTPPTATDAGSAPQASIAEDPDQTLRMPAGKQALEKLLADVDREQPGGRQRPQRDQAAAIPAICLTAAPRVREPRNQATEPECQRQHDPRRQVVQVAVYLIGQLTPGVIPERQSGSATGALSTRPVETGLHPVAVCGLIPNSGPYAPKAP